MKHRKKIALVIGWGSVKCAASLGLLRVLIREGIPIDMVVTSGGGAIYGGLFALGHNVEEIIAMNARLWTHEVTQKTNSRAILQILFPRLFHVHDYFNLRDDTLVNSRLREAFGEATFADTQIPLFISATEYKTGQQVILSQGSLYEAVRATIALPLIFPPLKKDDHMLADGYLSDPLPIGIALQEGADIIIAMGFASIPAIERKGFSDYLLHVAGLLSNNLLQASYAFYNLAHHSEVFMILPDFKETIHIFDTHKVPQIIKAGEEEGEKLLPRLKKALEETPHGN